MGRNRVTAQSQIQDVPKEGAPFVPSRRDSVVGGGGSSRNFPWSPNADVIQWGGVVAEIFRRGSPGLKNAGSSRTFALIRHF